MPQGKIREGCIRRVWRHACIATTRQDWKIIDSNRVYKTCGDSRSRSSFCFYPIFHATHVATSLHLHGSYQLLKDRFVATAEELREADYDEGSSVRKDGSLQKNMSCVDDEGRVEEIVQVVCVDF